MKCVSIQNISVNEVYYTISKTLPVEIMLCNILHYQKYFELKHISHKIGAVGGSTEAARNPLATPSQDHPERSQRFLAIGGEG